MKFVLTPSTHSAIAPWNQDELVKQSDVIAIVEIYEKSPLLPEGSVLDKDGKEVSTALFSYSSNVLEVLHGRIAKTPFIIQFDAGCINLLEKGKYILFLKSEGHLFTPLADFKINKDSLNWYKKRFFVGDYGPEFGDTPLNEAIGNIRQIIKEYKSK